MVFLTKHFVQDTMANIELVTMALEGCVIEYTLYKILPFFINFSWLITIKGIDYQSLASVAYKVIQMDDACQDFPHQVGK